jgi:enamine deaminase RidA (YjgF/YER057c/UK114 family)
MSTSCTPSAGFRSPAQTGQSSEPFQRVESSGLTQIVTGSPDCAEYHLTLRPLPGEGLAGMLQRLSASLQKNNAIPVQQFVFGNLEVLKQGDAEMRRAFGNPAWPVTWVDGASCDSNALAGIQVLAVSKRPVEIVRLGDRVVGCVFTEGHARHCLLGGMGPQSTTETQSEQTRQTLHHIEAALEIAGFSFGDIARTWFFLDDILSWYGDFNKARTAFYGERPFRIGSLPASTGIRGRNPAGAALTVGVWAVKPSSPLCRVEEVASPLQCPAPCYGSSFSRAMEIGAASTGRRLQVSGTASIEPGGKTVWIDDIHKQVDLTMQVVEAILKSRGMNLQHTTRAIAYFKKAEYAAALPAWLAASGNAGLPCIPVCCDICRDDLLFEIELDAFAP